MTWPRPDSGHSLTTAPHMNAEEQYNFTRARDTCQQQENKAQQLIQDSQVLDEIKSLYVEEWKDPRIFCSREKQCKKARPRPQYGLHYPHW